MKKWFVKAAVLILIIVMSVVSLYPFYAMIIMSTYVTEDIFKGVLFVPGDYLFENLKTVMGSEFIRSYCNSIFVSVSAVLGCVLVSSMAGYALTVYTFRFRNVALKFVMMTMMVPSQIGIIGYMIEMRVFGLTGTLWPLIFGWFASGFGAFWMSQFTQGALPVELVESARIDGCNEFGVFFKIFLPCVRAGIVTLALLIFLWSWNSYSTPLVFVNNPKNYTIPLFVRSLSDRYRTDYAAQLLGLSLATVPLLIMFIVGSKNFIKGLTAGAVKG